MEKTATVRMILVPLALWICGAATLFAQELPDWENPEVVGINKEPAHCTLIPFSNVEEAMKSRIQDYVYSTGFVEGEGNVYCFSQRWLRSVVAKTSTLEDDIAAVNVIASALARVKPLTSALARAASPSPDLCSRYTHKVLPSVLGTETERITEHSRY